ncbi:DUF4347 domain-containing protein [Neolewinella agarilytica]|uniref:PKD domain-containing protein n=1 Tax=Neolewinella agarilytica TaxID=478744 RepID=A0A1H9MLI5_9BACT|nr:DUF4347 domain-containing protein [Neolewinella agarilytica]SER24556.1 protein of unknown function [Neolewinella agarilytica]
MIKVTFFQKVSLQAYFTFIDMSDLPGRVISRSWLVAIVLTGCLSFAMPNQLVSSTLTTFSEPGTTRCFVDSSVSNSEVLSNAAGYASGTDFHLFSHGRSGELFLDGEWRAPMAVAAWLMEGNYLIGVDQLNIYGCSFGEGQRGRAAVAQLTTALGIPVAASDDITGRDGDWELEVGSGGSALAFPAYKHNLQGFYDCASILEIPSSDIFTEPARYSHTKIVDGTTYVVQLVQDPYNLPIINGSPSNSTGFSEVYIAIFDENCNQTLGTFLPGSSANEFPMDMTVDADGNILVVGVTNSNGPTPIPTTDATQASGENRLSAYLSKVTPTGNLVFQTLVTSDVGNVTPIFGNFDSQHIAVGDDGSVFISLIGQTGASGILTTDGSTPGAGEQFIIARRYDPNGGLIYSRIIDYSGRELVSGMVVTGTSMWIGGDTRSSDFMTTDGTTFAGGPDDVYLIKLNPDGTTALSTLIGGSGDDAPPFLITDGSAVYAVEETNSSDFVTTTGVTYDGADDSFYAIKYNSDGTLAYTTLINADQDVSFSGTSGLFVRDGALYFSGQVNGDPGALFPTNACTPFVGSDPAAANTAVVKLDVNGNVAYASLLGGADAKIFVNAAGEAFILSETGDITNNFTTDGSVGRSGTDDIYLAKLDANGCICLGSYLNDLGSGDPGGRANNSDIYVDDETVYFTILDSDLSTDGTVSFPDQNNPALIKYSFCPPTPTLTPSPLTPDNQSVCINGLVEQILAAPHEIDASGEVPIFINGARRSQSDIPLVYQWQFAPGPTGPWSDVEGPLGLGQNYSPPVTGLDIYYRRLTSNFECCGGEVISISETASILVGTDEAPDVDAGGVFYTCPGTPVMIGGAPTASGGSGGGYVYDWNDGAFTIANPTVSPTESTIYTVRVTDGAGCIQADQATVVVYTADAGEDEGICNGESVTIGGPAVMGLTIVDEGNPVANEYSIAYTWTGNTATLSCTNCPNPVASPGDGTTETYTLTVTLYYPNGTSCSSTDMMSVTTTESTIPSGFAGPDIVACVGEEVVIGSAAEPGYTYSWAPGVFLSSTSGMLDQSMLTFSVPIPDDDDPTLFPDDIPNPITYTVAAEINGCVTYDQVSVYVIEARADEVIESDTMCGPRTLGEIDRTPDIDETYSWRVISSTGDNSMFLGPTDGPRVPVSGNNAGMTAYELTVSYTSPSGAMGVCRDTSYVPPCGCVVEAEVENGGCADFDSGNVGILAYASSSADGPGPADFDYTWTPMAGLNRYDSSYVELTDNVARTYTVQAVSKTDPNFSCTVEVPVNQANFATPTFNATSPVTSCPNEPLNIGDPAALPGLQYQWSPSQGLDDPTSANPEATLTVSTEYTVTVTDALTGCEFLDTVFVEVGQAAAAGGDIYVCDNGVVTLGTNEDRSAEGYSYSWTPILPAGDYRNGTNQNSAQPEVFITTNQTFTLTVTGPAPTSCMSTDMVNVIVEPTPGSITLSDIEFCPSSSNIVLGYTGGATSGTNEVPTGFGYQWSPGALLNDPTLRNPTVNSPLPSSDITFTLELRSASGGCSSEATQQLLLSSSIVPPETTNGVVCVDESISIGSAANTTGPGISYQWLPNDGNLSDPNSPNPSFSSSTTGRFTYTVTRNDNGCATTGEVTVNVVEVNAPPLQNEVICQGDPVVLGPAIPEAGVSYEWSPATGLDDPFIANPTFTGTMTTTFTLTVVNSQGCTDEAVVTVVVNPPPTFMVSLPDTTPVCDPTTTTSIVLDASVDPAGDYAYRWTPTNNLSSASVLNPTFFVPGPGQYEYVLEVIDNTTGCSIRDTTLILTDASFMTPMATINDPDDQCVNGTDMAFVGGPAVGTVAGDMGVFSVSPATAAFTDAGDGTAILDVSAAAPGTYQVSYTYFTESGCDDVATSTVEVFGLPTVTLNDPADQCIDGTDMTFMGTPAPGTVIGDMGVFSISPVTAAFTDAGDGTATLDVSDATPGTYQVSYTYTNENGCDDVAMSTVEVFAPPVVTLNDPDDQCIDGMDMIFTGSPTVGAAIGDMGVFSISPATVAFTDAGDGTATLDVSAAGAGAYQVSYTYTNENGCTSVAMSSVEVFALPVVTLNDPDDECTDGTDMTFTGNPVVGTGAGDMGVFSVSPETTAFTDAGDGTATLDVSGTAPGTYQVTYTYTNENGCEGVATSTVEVFDPPVVTLAPPASICSTQPIDLTVGASISPNTLGGTWSSSGNGNFTSGTDFATATSYTLGSDDIAAGEVTLTLTSDDPDGPCGTRSESVTFQILNVDCGQFFWDGN